MWKINTLQISGALLIGLLSGCSIIGQPVKKVETPTGPPPPTAEELYAKAACQSNRAQGLAMAKRLLADDPDNVATKLVHAYMVEQTGRPVQAWELYSSLADGNYGQTTSLSCGGVLVYNGAVSDVAKFRSLWLAEHLKAQGVDLSPEMPQTNNLLPPNAEKKEQVVILPPPFAENKPQAAPPAVPTVPVKKEVVLPPKSPDGIFIHLASYKGPKALDRGWKEISSRHQKLLASFSKASQSVTLKGKTGRILRLGVRAADKSTALSLCKALKAARQYCAVLK